MRALSRVLLVLYVLLLARLLLFKLSTGLLPVDDYYSRSVNWIPFKDVTFGTLEESLFNCIVFVPLGLILSAAVKGPTLRSKLVAVVVGSIAVEFAQYVLAVGVTDVTDVITNTLGGLLGLVLYELLIRRVEGATLDRRITIAGIVVLLMALMLFVLLLSQGLRYR